MYKQIVHFLIRIFKIMKVRWPLFTILVVVWVSILNSAVRAYNVDKIKQVRQKEVLTEGDFQIIDDFIAETTDQLMKTTDFSSISRIRTDIILYGKPASESAADQYKRQFSKSLYKYLSKALADIPQLEPKERQFKTLINILILIDQMYDLTLAQLAIDLVDNESSAVRYWAIHSLTNDGIVEKLNSSDNKAVSQKIADKLEKTVKNSNEEIMVLAANFAAKVNIPQAKLLLLQIADRRIEKYAAWDVHYANIDVELLQLLYNKANAGNPSEPDVARRFGQLYAYAMQMYIKGGNILNELQKRRLAPVLAETEKSCLTELLGQRITIQMAVAKDDFAKLQREYENLFGSSTTKGILAEKLNFDYGRNEDGSERIYPQQLPDPPKKSDK